MIDLHLHLDGSLDAEFIIKQSEKQNIILPYDNETDLNKLLIAPSDCKSLNEYLKCFDIPLAVLQTEDAIMQAVYYLAEKLNRQGILYAEIRFAPQLHTKKGLSMRQAVEAALVSMAYANENLDIKCQLILCCMRGGIENKPANIETVYLAEKYRKQGVAAIDLAGAEALYETKDFGYLFEISRDMGLPFVIHAGEADGIRSVEKAIEFGASRIGHGIALSQSEGLMDRVKDTGIAIEMCLSSNLQTKAINNIDEFPLRKFLDKGLICTINTDNMTVSDTTIAKEFGILKESLGLSDEEKRLLLTNSVKSSFLSEADKSNLMLKVLSRLKK